MKTFKKVLSVALALIMVVGLATAVPTEVKADAIAKLTTTVNASKETGAFCFKLSDYCTDFVEGGDYKITIQLSSDGTSGSYGGGLGASDAAGWTQKEWSGDTTATIVYDGVKLNDYAELQVWWMNEGVTYINVDSVTIVKSGAEEEKDEPTGIHTFKVGATANKSDGDFTVNVTNYLSTFKDGDDVTISIKLTGAGYFNGCIGYNSGDKWEGAQQECSGGTTTWTVEAKNLKGNPLVQIWWMNDGVPTVTIEEIVITAAAAPAPAPVVPETGDVATTSIIVLLAGIAILAFAAKKRFA